MYVTLYHLKVLFVSAHEGHINDVLPHTPRAISFKWKLGLDCTLSLRNAFELWGLSSTFQFLTDLVSLRTLLPCALHSIYFAKGRQFKEVSKF